MPSPKAKQRQPFMIHRFKHAFTVILISFILMLIVPVANSIYLFSAVVKITERNCVEDTLSLLDTAGGELAYVLSSLDNVALRMVYDSSLHAIMYMSRPTDGDSNINTFLKFSKKCDEMLGAVSGVSEGYRLLLKDNQLIFYNGAMSTGLEFYFNTALKYQGMTYEQWLEAIFTPQTRSLLPADTILFGKHTTSALTYNLPITRKANDGTVKSAVVQFFIDVQTLASNLPFLTQGGSAYLVDANGRVLAQLGAALPYPFEGTVLLDSSGSLYQNNNLIIHTPISQDLQLVAALPKSYALKDANELRIPLFGVLILCVLLELFLCFILARQTARPIERFASSVRPLLSDPGQENEYAYFERSIAQLRQSQQTATAAMAQKRKVEMSLLLDRLFDEDHQDMAALFELAGSLGVDLNAHGYCVATIESTTQPSLKEEQALLSLPQGLRCLFHSHQSQLVSLLYFCDTPETNLAYDRISAHLNLIKQGLTPPVRMGVGRIYPSINDVAFSFQQSFYCLQHDGALNSIAIFDRVSRNSNAPSLSLDQQQRLLNAVKHNNIAVIDEQMDKIIYENTQKRHLSSSLKKLLIANVESMLLMAAEEMAQEENLSDYLLSLQRHSDMREQLELLRDEFKKISNAAANRFNVRNVLLRKEIEDYLASVYADSSLSATTVSDHFGLSESYFSMLFKDLMGESYSAYIEKMRLDKAKTLMQNSSMNMEAIAQAVGYNNSTTFRRAFKRVVGISPIQYRQET